MKIKKNEVGPGTDTFYLCTRFVKVVTIAATWRLRRLTCHFGIAAQWDERIVRDSKLAIGNVQPDTGGIRCIGNENEVFCGNSKIPLQGQHEIAQSLLLGRGGSITVEIADQTDADAVAFDALEPGGDAGW